MLDDAQLRDLALQAAEHVDGPVARAVVDDDDLEVLDGLAERAVDIADHPRDGELVVVAGEERRNVAYQLVARDHASSANAPTTCSTSSSVSSGKHGNDMHSAAHASDSGQRWTANCSYAGCCVSASG